MKNPFQNRIPSILDNEHLRTPQREAYAALDKFSNEDNGQDREVGIVLPVGCGKSGCITLAPFAFRSRRTLVIAPNVKIARQLQADFDPANENMFYTKCGVLDGQPFPEPAEIHGQDTNFADLEEAHVVITNIQQLQGQDNRWLRDMHSDFFDLILFDEGHHNVAQSWDALRHQFPSARIINFSATPHRADGQCMAGHVIYSYAVFRAIQEGYVKSLSARVLNPRTLRYVRREDGQEIEVQLDEVRRLGEEEADFRRSILTSEETLNTIVDASIRALGQLRNEAGDTRLKIIASALNYHHCIQVVEAYRARGLRAGFVHSRQDSAANDRVERHLNSHNLDVIVQVRKLGEGFDHPYLAVAAVFSVFANLSPFVQFVGRIMRVIEQNAPDHELNRGIVVFHAGANVARRWEDFQQFSAIDRDFFDRLLPIEELNFNDASELEINPEARENYGGLEVLDQGPVEIQEISLIQEDAETMAALERIRQRGYTSDELVGAYETLSSIPVTAQRRRRAMRSSLDERVRTETGRILRSRGINPGGHELDRQHHGKDNFRVMKSNIDRCINEFVDRSSGERQEFTRSEFEQINQNLARIIENAVREVFDATD